MMGSGVALQIKNKYPEAFNIYKNNSRFLGTYTNYNYSSRVVINAITQESYGRDGSRFVSYDAIEEVFFKINNDFTQYEKVAMPLIGASLGGGNWAIISSIIENTLTKVQPVVYLYD